LISTAHLDQSGYWLNFFRTVWDGDPPFRLHTRALDEAGNPDMTNDFLNWLDGTTSRHEGTEDRARLKRALKRIRERSLREYEVIYRVMVLSQPISEVTDWLNDRAIRAGSTERYMPHETSVIVYAAVDKLGAWW
jgi:hypothetical protein